MSVELKNDICFPYFVKFAVFQNIGTYHKKSTARLLFVGSHLKVRLFKIQTRGGYDKLLALHFPASHEYRTTLS